MPTPSKPQLAIYAAAAIAVLLIGARFVRASGGASGGASAYSSATGGGSASGSAGAATGTSAAGASGAGTVGPDGTEPPGGAAGASSGTAGAGAVGADGTQTPVGTVAGAIVVDVKGAVRRPGVYRLTAGARALDAVRLAGGLTHRADRIGINLAARVVDGGEVVVPERGRGNASPASAPTADAPATGAPGTSAAAPISIDLNTATEQQLEQLDGVGPATAAKIVAYRTQHGGIGSVDELDNVPGIGPAKLAAIRAQLGR